jgi:hypothetical protein
MTRIIGYLKRVSNFSAARQKEAARRYYAGPNKMGQPETVQQEILGEKRASSVIGTVLISYIQFSKN